MNEWTTTPPEKPGYYWVVLDEAPSQDAFVVWVDVFGDWVDSVWIPEGVVHVSFIGDDVTKQMTEYLAETRRHSVLHWSGPLRP